jgi:hypothetical protein
MNPHSFITFFQSFCQQIDIVLLVDDIHTLVNVVIVHPIRVNLVLHATISRGWLQQ